MYWHNIATKHMYTVTYRDCSRSIGDYSQMLAAGGQYTELFYETVIAGYLYNRRKNRQYYQYADLCCLLLQYSKRIFF